MLLDLNVIASLKVRLPLITVNFLTPFRRVYSKHWLLLSKWAPWQLAIDTLESDDERTEQLLGKGTTKAY